MGYKKCQGFCSKRSGRILARRTCSTACLKEKGGQKCVSISEEYKQALFEDFWENMEWAEKGVYVIVVTPEKVDKVKETSKKFKSTFSIIHDADNKIMNDYKVAFDVNKDNVPNYFEFTFKKVRAYNESNNDVLPVPATYLIDKNALISYVHYDPDYKKRADLGEIINLLE